MKKLIGGLVLLALIIGLFSVIVVKAEARQAKMKNLIVYYSYTGNTELVAKTLAEIIKADVLKIEDKATFSMFKALTVGCAVARKGQAWPVQPFNKDVSGYERIFLGAPVWAGMPAPQFNAFVEQVDFTGKEVVVFVTMGRSGQDKAIKAMTDKIRAKGGKVVSAFFVKSGRTTKEDIVNKTKEIAKQY